MSTPPTDKVDSIAKGTGLPLQPPEAPQPKQGSLNGREVTSTPPPGQAVNNEYLRRLREEREQRHPQPPAASASTAIPKERSKSRIVTLNDFPPPPAPPPAPLPTYYDMPQAIPPPPPPIQPVLPNPINISHISYVPIDPYLLSPAPLPPPPPQPPPAAPQQLQVKKGRLTQLHVGITILALSVLAIAASVTVSVLKQKGLITHEFTLLGYTYNTAAVVAVTLCVAGIAGLLGGFLTIISYKETDEEVAERLVAFGKKHGLDLQVAPPSLEALHAQQYPNNASATSKS